MLDGRKDLTCLEIHNSVMSEDISRLKRRAGLVLAFAVAMASVGLLFIAQGGIAWTAAGIAWIAVFSLPIAYIGVKTLKKIPPTDAYLLGSSRQDISALGDLFWFDEKGIWLNNRLMYSWDDVKEVEIVKTWTKELELLSFLDLLGGTGAFEYGTVRIDLKGGYSIIVPYVADPEERVKLIKSVFLRH